MVLYPKHSQHTEYQMDLIDNLFYFLTVLSYAYNIWWCVDDVGIDRRKIVTVLYYRVIIQLQCSSSSLAEGGIILPQHISVIGQLLESDWLVQVSRVQNLRTCGYDIARFINEYQVIVVSCLL